MNKEDILARSRQENKDEINEYIDNKAMHYGSILFMISCIIMILLSFQSSRQSEILYATLCLLFAFFSIYFLTRYYYMRSFIYLIIGFIVLTLSCYYVVQVWLLIW